MTAHTQFSIKNLRNNDVFSCQFGDGPAIVTDGYGGWQVTDRPKNIGVTEWKGRNPLAVEIPFFIDHYRSEGYAEAQVGQLERMAGLGSGDQPPILIVDGGGAIPHDHTVQPSGRWVIEGLVWDKEMEIRGLNSGKRIRCGGTLTIRQFVVAKDILRKIKRGSVATKPGWYKVQKGDTLSKIAYKKYHDHNKWKLIADANHIRDRRHLVIGDWLKIPPLRSH